MDKKEPHDTTSNFAGKKTGKRGIDRTAEGPESLFKNPKRNLPEEESGENRNNDY